jgi:nitronate monooxygenase
LENIFTRAMQDHITLAFPLQNTLTGPLRQWANMHHDAEYQSIWAGTVYTQVRSISTSALMQELRHEMADAATNPP